MHPLVLVLVFFLLSLTASIILFKWLENTAMVNVPFGKFGGAIAGFIGVYILLNNSYMSLTAYVDIKTMDLPSNYDKYISETWSFGFGYPKEVQFKEWPKRAIVGAINLGPKGTISMSVEKLNGNELEKSTKQEGIDKVVEKQIRIIKAIHKGHSIISNKDYSIAGAKGKIIEMEGILEDKNILTSVVIIPNFDNNILYFFDLTTLKTVHSEKLPKFQEIISTIRFF